MVLGANLTKMRSVLEQPDVCAWETSGQAQLWTQKLSAAAAAAAAVPGPLFTALHAADGDQIIQFLFPPERLPAHTQVGRGSIGPCSSRLRPSGQAEHRGSLMGVSRVPCQPIDALCWQDCMLIAGCVSPMHGGAPQGGGWQKGKGAVVAVCVSL
jgi:hypothetical protein